MLMLGFRKDRDMYSNTTRETKLSGMALCEVKLSDYRTYIVSTHITIPCTYTPDWQCDAHCWHDEGNFDFDTKDAYVTYPDEYKVIDVEGNVTEGDKEITKVVQVLRYNLNEDND